jgi:hypothetical protein
MSARPGDIRSGCLDVRLLRGSNLRSALDSMTNRLRAYRLDENDSDDGSALGFGPRRSLGPWDRLRVPTHGLQPKLRDHGVEFHVRAGWVTVVAPAPSNARRRRAARHPAPRGFGASWRSRAAVAAAQPAGCSPWPVEDHTSTNLMSFREPPVAHIVSAASSPPMGPTSVVGKVACFCCSGPLASRRLASTRSHP